MEGFERIVSKWLRIPDHPRFAFEKINSTAPALYGKVFSYILIFKFMQALVQLVIDKGMHGPLSSDSYYFHNSKLAVILYS